MKIGIVAPSPVPFTIGGAEKFARGLAEYLNQETSHQAELIKLPSRELNFWDLIDSYRAFSRLDVSHFDMVISSKYPAWMAAHPRHIVYMLHRLRGLYDTYPPLPPRYDGENAEARTLCAFLRRETRGPEAIEECFERLAALRAVEGIPAETFAFPGPLIREIVHYLDDCAIAPERVAKYAAISKNVAGRAGYFPPGADVEVLYPPSDLPAFRRGDSDYFVSVGRLDSAKRTRLIVEAMLRAETTLPLKIAGTGPEEAALRELAGGDKRIEFLGFVNDRDAVDLYANALAAIYTPYDEDYGLVAIEAMASGKPVLTTTDAGGPNEFVVDGETGYVVAPEAEALAERIDYLSTHIPEARGMAEACRKKVAPVTWERVVKGLLGAEASPRAKRPMRRRARMTVAVTFPVYPPRGGGKNRVYYLYRALARELDCDVELITFADDGQAGLDQWIAEGVREIRTPKSARHRQRESRISVRAGRVPVTDVAMPRLFALSPDYLDALAKSAKGSGLLVACHPYLLPALECVREGQAVLYEAHNTEFALKRRVLPDNAMGRYLLRLTREVEGRCCAKAGLISACAESDAEAYAREYGADPKKIVVAPNGVDLGSITFRPPGERAKRDGPFTVLFMGSWHDPNIEAALFLMELARLLPHVRFQLLGSVGQYFRVFQLKLPGNVETLGTLDDRAKDVALGSADLALNPMETGSGSNLKMLDYMAAGTPVLSTPFGARGLRFQDGRHLLVAPLIRFPHAIEEARREGIGPFDEMARRARAVVEAEYSWEAIGRRLAETMRERGIYARAAVGNSNPSALQSPSTIS